MASNSNIPHSDQTPDHDESISWILKHKKMLQYAMEYRAVKLGLKSKEAFEVTKATAAYQRLSPSTLLLIKNIGDNFSNLELTVMYEFQTLFDKGMGRQSSSGKKSEDGKKREESKEREESEKKKDNEQKKSSETQVLEAEFDNSINNFYLIRTIKSFSIY